MDAPPPLFPAAGGAVTTASDGGGPTSPPSSTTLTVTIIVASAVVVTAALYLLIRFVTRHCSHDDVYSSDNTEVAPQNCGVYERRTSHSDLTRELPVFSFGSIGGNLAGGGDCAVCLSKFEPNDRLRLLPYCCHAFHANCIDAWLCTNRTCPLCRSDVRPTESAIMDKVLSSSHAESRENSFRIEIGSSSSRGRTAPISGDGWRSYSIGSFEYVVDRACEVPVGLTLQRGGSNCSFVDKDFAGVPARVSAPRGESITTDVAGRSWLMDYLERLGSITFRSRSIRSSGGFRSGSIRRSSAVTAAEDLEANRYGEEISELFRWLSGE